MIFQGGWVTDGWASRSLCNLGSYSVRNPPPYPKIHDLDLSYISCRSFSERILSCIILSVLSGSSVGVVSGVSWLTCSGVTLSFLGRGKMVGCASKSRTDAWGSRYSLVYFDLLLLGHSVSVVHSSIGQGYKIRSVNPKDLFNFQF